MKVVFVAQEGTPNVSFVMHELEKLKINKLAVVTTDDDIEIIKAINRLGYKQSIVWGSLNNVKHFNLVGKNKTVPYARAQLDLVLARRTSATLFFGKGRRQKEIIEWATSQKKKVKVLE